jgi:hypothetical protein
MAYAGGCGVYAIVRKNIYDPAKLDRGREQLAKFDELHAQQPGFRGTITNWRCAQQWPFSHSQIGNGA